MKVSECSLITFSPTHTSRKIGESILEGMNLITIRRMDLTLPTCQEIDEHVILTPVVITVPVYGGQVAPLALQRMDRLRGNATPAVIVVVYGNRAYDGALFQLASFVEERGFVVIAAGAFIGEHSYSSSATPIASGRPSEQDLEEARLFGNHVRCKLESLKAEAEDWDVLRVNVSHLRPPRQSLFSLMRFGYGVFRLRHSKQGMPVVPSVDAALCTHCGTCVAVCPAGAIHQEDELHTDAGRCIHCCACVKGCVHGARRYSTPFARLLSVCFWQDKKNVVIL